MSGHNKWSSIKHQKGAADAKRGQLFTKLTREIMVAVREDGANLESNFRLRLAVDKARAANMPLDNIDRAIQRGSGTADGASLVEMLFEGYGPGGSAILVEALTDNRNRTVQEVRNLFSRSGGSLGEAGSVAWLFEQKGLITAEPNGLDPDEVTLKAIDAGAEDVVADKDFIEIYTKPGALETVKGVLEKSKIHIGSAEVCKAAKTTIELDDKASLQTLKLLHKLEELDDVRCVYSNVNFSSAVMKKYEEEA
ncbi:MAG TPA: YebC/PmpR family DNA-binding transcriptional regulator [Dehalococcoidales bacterium]|nr:YebC/PmpR family DNA-binding transcriptional regulator [Dehalococcoidales bacterium]